MQEAELAVQASGFGTQASGCAASCSFSIPNSEFLNQESGIRNSTWEMDGLPQNSNSASQSPCPEARVPYPVSRAPNPVCRFENSRFENPDSQSRTSPPIVNRQSSIDNRQSTIGNCPHADYERLAEEIEQITGLPLALEGVYRFAVFLPSRQCAEIPVPNRFFCVSEEGELKVRGLECRRHDTPPFVTRMQRQVLAILAEARDFSTYCDKLHEAREVYERYQERLRDGSVAAEELVIRKRLTKAPASYQKNSSTAIAARQLDRAGVKLRPGENIEFIITDANSSLIDDRVRAWTLWEGWRGYDVEAYGKALEKAFEPAAHFGRAVDNSVTGGCRINSL
jgi:hypothetical protein